MATLQSILNEVQYGKEYCEFENFKQEILENYNQDTDIFSASGRITNLVKNLVMSPECEKIVEHITNKCELVENKLYNQDVISPQYKKIQAISIIEDCNKIIRKTDKRGEYDSLPKKKLAQVIATAKYFTETYLENVNLIECHNFEFNNLIKDDYQGINQVM